MFLGAQNYLIAKSNDNSLGTSKDWQFYL